MKYRIYKCWFKGDEWVMFIAAKNIADAKKVFWHEKPITDWDADYIDIRIKSMRATIDRDTPGELEENELFIACSIILCKRCEQYHRYDENCFGE